MYNKVECVTLTCDNCNEAFISYEEGFSIFTDESQASEYADEAGWSLHNDDGKHYCDECFHIDDNDVQIINAERTK